jgi:hypothetical protein
MNDEKRELIAQIVTAGRQKLFGTPDCCLSTAEDGSWPFVGATGKENWLFHKLLDRVESNARSFGKPHVRATYEAVGALSESEWAQDVAAGRLPSNVNTHRGPLTNVDVLQEARRNWESALETRSETEVDVVVSRATIPAKVKFVLGSEDGVVWLATASSALLNRRWEPLSSESDRFDSALQVQPSAAAAAYIEHAREFVREADRTGDTATATAVRRTMWKRFKTALAWAGVVLSFFSGTVIVSYAQSKTFRDAVRDRLPRAAGVLDAITSTPPAPVPRPPAQRRSANPPNSYNLVELGEPVATETVNIADDYQMHPLRYDESSPALPVLMRKGPKVEPQIVVTRSARNPRQALIRAFLGDVQRGNIDSFVLMFDDGEVLAFDGNLIENLAGHYRGFMLAKTFSKAGSHEVSLWASKKDDPKSGVEVAKKRFNLDATLAAQPELHPIAPVAPYEPVDEDVLPSRDGVFQLVYEERGPESRLKRDTNGRVESQILTTARPDGRLLFKVFLGPEFDDVKDVGVWEPGGAVHLMEPIGNYSRKYRGMSIVYTPTTTGPQTLQIRAVRNGSVGISSQPEVSVTFDPPSADQ